MGILGKIVGAGFGAVGAGFEAIGRKVEDVFLKREQKNLEYIANYPYTYKYIIREVKEVQDDMNYAKELGLKKNFFGVYSSENTLCIWRIVRERNSVGANMYLWI